MEASRGLAAATGIIIGPLDLSLAAVLKLNDDFTGGKVHDRDPFSHSTCFSLEGNNVERNLSFGNDFWHGHCNFSFHLCF
jgi:hypothetical protein